MKKYIDFKRNLQRCSLVPLLLLLFLPTLIWASEQPDGVPYRVVSLSPVITENLFLLGLGEQLVGNTTYCNRPAAAQKIAKVGSVMEINIEKIVRLRPDLILVSNLTPLSYVEQFNKLGLRTEYFPQTTSFAEICDQFVGLGRVLGREKEAQEIVRTAQEQVDEIHAQVQTLPKQGVFLQVGADPLFSSMKDSFTNEYILFGGGENIAEGMRFGSLSTEHVLALAPDVIIIAVMGSESGVGAQEKKKWERYTTLKAVKAGRVHVLDADDVCSPSPLTFARVLETMAYLIHPEMGMKSSRP